MKLAEKLAVIYSLFRVSLCSGSFSLALPPSVEAVKGLCVLLPCTFTIKDGSNEHLLNDPKGIWYKDDTQNRHRVYDSTSPENKIKGEIIGDLRMKNCTIVFNSFSGSDSGRYYFRIEAGELRYTYRENSVSINVRDGKPTLSLYRDQKEVEDWKVLEGSSVSLLCSALSPCPTELPTLTWSPLVTNSSQEQNQNTSFISSQLSFITTHLHHGLRVNCTVTYQQENKDPKTTKRSLVLHVLYPPRNTSVSVSPSGPVMLGSLVTLTCSSDGNPAVNYTWYRENGEQIETGPTLTINETDSTHSGLYCRAQNQHGAEDSPVQLDIQCNFNIFSMLIGAATGASTVMILCAMYLSRRTAHHKPSQDSSAGLVLNDKAVYQKEEEDAKEEEEGESLYANKDMLSPKRSLEHVMNYLDSLHYSTIYFPNGEEVCGEIRGLSSLTSEYATVQQSSREDPESETTDAYISATNEEQTNSDTVNEEEIEQPTKEEETYGNIVRNKTSQSDLDADLEIERLETKPADPEQLAEAEAAEGIYAEVRTQSVKGV